MRLSYAAGALALCASASAFSDTSPFILISTASFAEPPSEGQLQTSSRVTELAKSFLKSCPTGEYLVVSQPNLNPVELRSSSSAPNLRQALAHDKAATKWTVSGVAGEVSLEEIRDYIDESCRSAQKTYSLREVNLDPLPSRAPASKLADNDYTLGEPLRNAQARESYTIIYLTTPGQPAEIEQPMSSELKRAVNPDLTRRQEGKERDTRSLFQKYQFFSDGLFMGILATAFLVTILGFGLRSMSSLQVSYGAFSKEMGPAAQKKQQQM